MRIHDSHQLNPSSKYTNRLSSAVTPDVLYRGSNVSLMVTNEIYESSDGFLREGILGGAAQPGTAQPPGGDRVGGKTITVGTALQSGESVDFK